MSNIDVFNYDISEKGIFKIIKKFFGEHLKSCDVSSVSCAVWETLEEDIKFIASLDPSQNNVEIVKNLKSKSLVATMCFRIANYLYYSNVLSNKEKLTREFMEIVASQTSIDIHPAAKIGKQFFIDHGANIVIGSTCIIGERCNLFNDVVLGSKNVKTAKPEKRHPTIKDDVTICAGARVLGNITVGNNCFICPHAVVLDDVPDNTQVSVVNQLQLTKRINSLPSQKLIIYGVVPKFKNTLKILGEGFYNPTVLIKLKNDKSLNYQIIYWDKNKILIKIKNTTPFSLSQTQNAKIVVLSNADKVIITQSYGLTKTLTTLTT